ncbi:MAG: hypothetical protein ACXAC7_20785 [Candidatus Hodarchaeales archaeon]
MKKSNKMISLTLLSLFVLFLTIQPSTAQVGVDYQVDVGDSNEYEVKKFNLGDGFNASGLDTGLDEELLPENIEVGNKFTVVITAVNTSVYGTVTYKTDTSEEIELEGFIFPTTGIASDWDSLVASTKTEGITVESSLDGEIFEMKSSMDFDLFGISSSAESIMHYNVTSGWLYYINMKFSFSGQGTSGSGEMEISKTGYSVGNGGIPGFEFIPLMFSIVIIAIFIVRRKKSEV